MKLMNIIKDYLKTLGLLIPSVPKSAINPWVKEQNMMEIVDHAVRELTMVRRKKQKKLTEY